MRRVWARQFLPASLALLLSGPCAAIGLAEAYDAALLNDPTYRAAVQERQAGREYEVLGRSAVLPVVSANYSTQRNHARIDNAAASGPERRSYRSESTTLQLRQPLYNEEGMARYRQGEAQTRASESQFHASELDLIVRVVSAYLAAQFAQDQLELALAQRDAYAEQRRTNERLFQQGEGTVTDTIETQAKFDLAEAQVLEARDAVVNGRNALAALIGQEVQSLSPLQDGLRVAPVQPERLDDWMAIALAENPDIGAQRYIVEVAEEEVKKSRAGHLPRIDGLLSASQSKSDSVSNYKQDTQAYAIGVQLTVPLYAGGATSASERQAEANLEKARATLAGKSAEVQVELRKQHSALVSARARIDALVKSLDSARLLVDATARSVKAGARTNLDVLNARRQWFEVRRDLANARYNYLIGTLRLRRAAGNLGAGDVKTVAAHFDSAR